MTSCAKAICKLQETPEHFFAELPSGQLCIIPKVHLKGVVPELGKPIDHYKHLLLQPGETQ